MRGIAKLLFVTLLLLLAPSPAHAYIGPGAGFALAGSFFAVIVAVFSAIVLVLFWPVRLLWRALFGRRPPARSRIKRVVVLGLDGLDHGLTEKMLAEGKLPRLAALRDQGCFKALGSTLPPISPVAWSSFQTGVNPGKHNIFDFLMPDLRTYQPKLSSVEIRPPRRMLRLGKYQVPLGKADVRMLRKSKPFWSVLSEYGIFNCIIRVPITFPPEKLRGVQLSAMCVPDLRGTQGMFSHYTTKTQREGEKTGGEVHIVVKDGNTVRAELIGPSHPFNAELGSLKAPFVVTIKGKDRAFLKIGGARHELKKDLYTDWIQVGFRVVPGLTVHGMCKFLLLRTEGEFELYATPVNIDPEKPAMPVGYPSVYSIYLAKKQGSYATLGLAEDTWGLSEHVLGDDHFLQQCLDTDREREAMFFDGLDKVTHGLCVCVFDGTDRMQHMFWRYHDEEHPARPAEIPAKHRHAIEDLYKRMDDLVGRTMARCQGKDTMLMVISDHGFNSFRRGIDLNRWLEESGYLKVDDSRRHEEHLGGIDWSQTRAFAIGLTGIFVNIKDKFAQGIVDGGEEAEKLRAEIAQRLGALVDPQTGKRGIKRVYQAPKAYRGPYKDHAPDLIVGYDRGYRVSWDAAIGRTSTEIFHANTKAWSGDHCVDPSVVPGVLFCNRPIDSDSPRLLDIGPTVLDMFGITVPEYMDGKPLAVGAAARERAS
ncbi:MAG TPA: alkaline phosphatase family protein [Gemmataceae bacterium]|jgi:predicted AlkP superfamily phosphohydrolase/phosphomutase|nr:alkaline phosphatase family protein [Gemmataceae bacterium]